MAVLFSLGIIVASQIRIALVWLFLWVAFFIPPAIFLLKRRFLGAIFLAVLIFLSGMIWLRNYKIIPGSHIRRFRYQRGEIYSLRGWVNSEPKYRGNKTSFLLQCAEISAGDKKQICCGKILAIVPGEEKFVYGQELVLETRLQRPFGKYLFRQGIYLVARLKSKDFVRSTGLNRGLRFKGVIFRFKKWIESKFENSLTPICAGILEAMILGEEKNIPEKVYKDMIRSGTVHILVVSGSNVGIVGFIIIQFLKIFRFKRRLRFFFAAPLLIAYSFLTGASNPVVRATIMAIVFLFAYLVKRQADIYNSCAVSALIILIMDPTQLFNLGFQLSFASVLAIAFFYPRFKKWLKLELIKSQALRFPLEGGLVSLSAWLGTVGLTAIYFRMVSPITVLANLFIVPLASLITLCGFSLLVIQSISSCLAKTFVPVNEFLVNLLLRGNNFLLQLPFACFYLSR